MSNKPVLAAFLGSLAVITYRDFKNPDSSWPLGPVPPPYRYTWAGVAFGICALISDLINPKIGAVIAGGLFIGLLFNVITKAPLTGKAPAPGGKSPIPGTTPVAPSKGVPT